MPVKRERRASLTAVAPTDRLPHGSGPRGISNTQSSLKKLITRPRSWALNALRMALSVSTEGGIAMADLPNANSRPRREIAMPFIIADEVRGKGVLVNVADPGWVRTRRLWCRRLGVHPNSFRYLGLSCLKSIVIGWDYQEA